MRPIRSALLLALAGAAIAGVAVAAADAAHVLTVRLPDGSVERIRYAGDVAPKVVLVPAARIAAADPAAEMFGAMFGGASPFAMMDRVSAEMDARADAMMHEAPAIGDTGTHMVSAGALPAGTMQYSMVSTTVNGRTCTRSTRLVAGANGAKPQLISQSAGDGCGTAAAAAPAAPSLAVQPAPATAPTKVTPVRLETPARPVRPARDTI